MEFSGNLLQKTFETFYLLQEFSSCKTLFILYLDLPNNNSLQTER